jgi:hypothetical protein
VGTNGRSYAGRGQSTQIDRNNNTTTRKEDGTVINLNAAQRAKLRFSLLIAQHSGIEPPIVSDAGAGHERLKRRSDRL